ncbi:MAG TPA: VanZ family protein [Levilinea sp.]|nr:VanZ family protein [Levilinea sp.]
MPSEIVRMLRWVPAVVVMGVIFWFSSLPGDEVSRKTEPVLYHAPETITVQPLEEPLRIRWLKVGHVIGYALLGLTYLYALQPGGRRAPFLAVALTLGYAVLDEFHQSFVPGRSARLEDVLLDVSAAILAISVWHLAHGIWRFTHA